MSTPQIYRKTIINQGRDTKDLTSDDQTKINNKIASFFTYFKAKHT
tara:strand:+ start:187 stop:324 length:138 start_codon:yes stop_codon:yes gene_type:complete